MMEETSDYDFIQEDSTVEELIGGPCPVCEELTLEEIVNHRHECESEETGVTEMVSVSGIRCMTCGEVFFNQQSAELIVNTLFRLDHELDTTHKLVLTDYGPEKVSIH